MRKKNITLPSTLANAESGWFDAPIADLSTQQWDRGLRRRLRRKGWIFLGACHERFIVGCAIADAGLLGTAFCYIYDRETQQLHESKITKPLAFTADFTPSPTERWHIGNTQRYWTLRYNPQANATWTMSFEEDNVQLTLALRDDQCRISAFNRFNNGLFQYTEKNVGCPATLTLRIDNESIGPLSAAGIYDFSLGYPPHHAQWQWASLCGFTTEGVGIGVNLVAQYFNGLENTLWHGNEIRKTQPLSQAVFHYQHNDVLAPWHIHTLDQRLQISFSPLDMRQESIEAGILASHFQQPFGSFTADWLDDHGKQQRFSGYGVVEQHSARW